MLRLRDWISGAISPSVENCAANWAIIESERDARNNLAGGLYPQQERWGIEVLSK